MAGEKKEVREIMDFRFERFGDIGLFIINDKDMTLKNIDRLKDALKWALYNVNHLILSFEKVKEVDFSFEKLICFARFTSIKLKKRLTVTGIQSEVFEKIVRADIYSRQMVA